ncbi:chorismate mutase [Pseudomonas agarici]|uniref:Chorismate mutase n=1 Tax=Pseudomonas agarici TaxID=46677 RepID=A0A0X1T3A6_PSEAA|nr:chorismate mutase [Pseudomonas agarici]AMB86545.1 chorismate mutase [Pseudomonas agarici]NWB92471.1 chorismate mutase [Pseudomonas agarici]NWC10715.1 chorismate mutase [Pseudomonas agarici]
MLPNYRIVSLLLASLLGANVLAAPAPAKAPDALPPLLRAISERLNIAEQVALTKWDSAKPIQDSSREQQVIANARQQAATYKIQPEDIGEFVAAQIEANKLVQYALLAKWRAAGKAPVIPRPDLVTQIRPALDRLQARLLQHYAAFAPYRQDPQCPAWLIQARQTLTSDTLHDLALIRATGELCQNPR